MHFLKQYHTLALLFCLIIFISDAQGKDKKQKAGSFPGFKLGLHLAGSMNYLNYGDVGAFSVASDYKWGGSLGASFDWGLLDFYNIRLEAYYEYQPLQNSYSDPLNVVDVNFTNHIGGLNITPIVLSYGGRIKPEISVGGFYNYLISSNAEATINGNPFEAEFDVNSSQYGISFGLGIYIGKRLIEIRLKKSFQDYVNIQGIENRTNQLKFVVLI